MLDPVYVQTLKEYVSQGFPKLAGSIAVRSFDPPLFVTDDCLSRFETRVEQDCRSQIDMADGFKAGILHGLFRDRASRTGIGLRRQFVNWALKPVPRHCPIQSASAGCAYITQFHSDYTLKQKFTVFASGQACPVPAETRSSHTIVDYMSLAHEAAHMIPQEDGPVSSLRPKPFCDGFAVVATLCEFGREALPVVRHFAAAREIGERAGNRVLRTSRALNAVLNEIGGGRTCIRAGEACQMAELAAGLRPI